MQKCSKKFSKFFSILNFFSSLVTKSQNTGSIRDGRSENTTRQRNVLPPAKLIRDTAAFRERAHIVD